MRAEKMVHVLGKLSTPMPFSRRESQKVVKERGLIAASNDKLNLMYTMWGQYINTILKQCGEDRVRPITNLTDMQASLIVSVVAQQLNVNQNIVREALQNMDIQC